MLEQMALFNEKAPLCNCKNEKVAYICTYKQCENHEKQKLYCQDCLDNGKHQHFPLIKMYKVMQDCDAKWAKLIENATKIEAAAKKKYNELKFLILYLDQELVEIPVAQMAQQQQLISTDLQKLVEIAAKIKDTLKIIEQMVSRGSVEDILGMDDTFKEYENTVQSMSYLQTLSFDTLYRVY